MKENEKTPVAPARLLVTRISALLEDLHDGERDLVAAFRQSPSTASFDRAMAYRTCILQEEIRAAVGRLENGSYGRCTLCGESIGTAELLESPLGRYCGHCFEKPGMGASRHDPGSRPSLHDLPLTVSEER